MMTNENPESIFGKLITNLQYQGKALRNSLLEGNIFMTWTAKVKGEEIVRHLVVCWRNTCTNNSMAEGIELQGMAICFVITLPTANDL